MARERKEQGDTGNPQGAEEAASRPHDPAHRRASQEEKRPPKGRPRPPASKLGTFGGEHELSVTKLEQRTHLLPEARCSTGGHTRRLLRPATTPDEANRILGRTAPILEGKKHQAGRHPPPGSGTAWPQRHLRQRDHLGEPA